MTAEEKFTKAVTPQVLEDYHNTKVAPYLGGAAGFTPVGTIIAVMGNSAPANYLACNGQTVNISDYPILANYFEAQFGTKNHFGGNGTSTFGIPDLRGEFLRGTGTNSHANQGNGANVGVHQNGTDIPYVGFNQTSGDIWIQTSKGENLGTDSLSIVKTDTIAPAVSNKVGRYWRHDGTFTGTGQPTVTIRPTNTSVLYCIATHNIFMNPANQYSTEEQVVGTWIDGKPIYQKTINFGALPNNTTKTVANGINNIDRIISLYGLAKDGNGNYLTLPDADNDGAANIRITATSTTINIANNYNRSTFTAYITLQYTKTTD